MAVAVEPGPLSGGNQPNERKALKF